VQTVSIHIYITESKCRPLRKIITKCPNLVPLEKTSMMFSFVNMSGLGDAWIAGKALFLGESSGIFPKEISIWISRLSKEDPDRRKDGTRTKYLSSWAGTCVFSYSQTGESLVLSPSLSETALRPLDLNWESHYWLHWFQAFWLQLNHANFLELQISGNKSWLSS
jgi:hypothetical protein